MSEQLPKSVKEGTLKIGNVELIVCVLEDGRRIIEEESFINFWNAMADGTLELTEADSDKLARAIKLGEF